MRKTQNTAQEAQNPEESRNARDFDFAQLKEMNASKLAQIARELGVSNATGARKQDA
jgi:hypothetical protein